MPPRPASNTLPRVTPPAATPHPPLKPPHLRYLDGWRGLAITAVLIGHFVYVPFINLGRVGVELFFVLSGRLMADVLFLKNYPLPDFFRRRIARVWPGLFVFVLAMLAAYARPGPRHVSPLDALGALTFILNYVAAAGHLCPVLNHIWTLCVEEHSYLFLAGIAFLARRYRSHAVGLCLGAAAVCILSGAYQSLILNGNYDTVYWRTDARASSILLACGLCLASAQGRPIRIPSAAPLILGLVGLLLNFNAIPDTLKYSLGTACLALAICTLDHAPAWTTRFLSHALPVQIGLWSFSLYLWQQPFSVVPTQHHHRLLLLLAVIPCALASFYLVEQPARQYLNKNWGRQSVKT